MKRMLLLISGFFTLLVLSALAQDLIVDVNLTMLSAFVEDEHGRPVLDLTADDFEVVENGQLRPVKHLSLETKPIAIGLVVDRSSSIVPVKKQIDAAVERMLEAAGAADQVFLMTFAGTGKLNVALTTKHKGILEAMRKANVGFGTRFYDVIIDSFQYL